MAIAPTIIIIFGGAGDLTWRKLVPSLFDLHQDGRMGKIQSSHLSQVRSWRLRTPGRGYAAFA
jgi:glucose-6-phosphate 1-dehydrogenase